MILIAQIILGISLLGLIVILFRKIPALAELPSEESPPPEVASTDLKGETANQITAVPFDNFLQKSLLKSRILTLKLENKISAWLERLRQKNKGGKITDTSSDDYWEQLKK